MIVFRYRWAILKIRLNYYWRVFKLKVWKHTNIQRVRLAGNLLKLARIVDARTVENVCIEYAKVKDERFWS